MNKDGTFDKRPEGAAPLFDSERGREAARKRWEKHHNDTPEKLDLEFVNNDKFGIVYFILADIGKETVVKIGTTVNLEKRLQSLQSANPIRLEVGFGLMVQKPRRIEKALHRQFKNKRIRGEWFRITIEDALMAVGELYAHE